MRMGNYRQSRNVEDRRGRGGRKGLVGGGIGAVVVVIIAALFGIDPGSISLPDDPSAGVGAPAQAPAELSPEEQRLGGFVSQVLASTEDTWTNVFQAQGGQYRVPTLVLFTDAVQSACGNAQAAMGPFYCPADEKVYIDLGFYRDLDARFGAPGDFAQAYVVAHEVGHHVQNLLGISDQVHAAQQRARGGAEANELSVRLELQADCFAGVWGNRADASNDILEKGDVEEGLTAAAAIGDDRLQREGQGYVVPESFTHGSSAQRVKWFRKGLSTGSLDACDTFNATGL